MNKLENDLIESIEFFNTGSVCIDLKRKIETVGDLDYFTTQVDKAYDIYEKEKKPLLFQYDGDKKCLIQKVR